MRAMLLLLSVGTALRLSPRAPAPRAPAPRLSAEPPSPEADRARDALSLRVRDALLDEEERPYMVWSEAAPRPLKINLDLLAHRARVLQRRGDAVGAAATLEHCTKLDPNDGRAWIALSRLRSNAGQKREAEALLREGLKWEPKSAHLLQAYGTLQERRGRQDEALELYSGAVRAVPSHAPSWVALALLLERRRQVPAAAGCLRVASRVAPRSYYVWQVIGEWHKRRGELGSAREAYRRSLECNSRNAAAYHGWGVLEWRCGHDPPHSARPTPRTFPSVHL